MPAIELHGDKSVVSLSVEAVPDCEVIVHHGRIYVRDGVADRWRLAKVVNTSELIQPAAPRRNAHGPIDAQDHDRAV